MSEKRTPKRLDIRDPHRRMLERIARVEHRSPTSSVLKMIEDRAAELAPRDVVLEGALQALRDDS